MPYAEVLPIAPKSWVTTKHQVARLRGIVTAPANLESTVLCVAHGLDVFFTRLHPSRSYDMLDEEFSYLLLVVTMVALVMARPWRLVWLLWPGALPALDLLAAGLGPVGSGARRVLRGGPGAHAAA